MLVDFIREKLGPSQFVAVEKCAVRNRAYDQELLILEEGIQHQYKKPTSKSAHFSSRYPLIMKEVISSRAITLTFCPTRVQISGGRAEVPGAAGLLSLDEQSIRSIATLILVWESRNGVLRMEIIGLRRCVV